MYKVTGVILDGSKFWGYVIEEEGGKELRVSIENFLDIARDNLIENCVIVNDNGKQRVVGKGIRLVDLPIIDVKMKLSAKLMTNSKLVLTKRVIRADRLVGYIAKDESGEEHKLSVEETWQLCREGIVTNAKAQFVENRKLLLGVDSKLRELPSYIEDTVNLNK